MITKNFEHGVNWSIQKHIYIVSTLKLTVLIGMLVLVTQIFLLSVQHVSPIVVQAITLPCLKILSQFVKPKPATTKANTVSIFTR